MKTQPPPSTRTVRRVAIRAEEGIRGALAAGQRGLALERLLQLYGPDMRRALHARSNAGLDPEDLYSAFLERVWRGLPGFRAESSWRTWVLRIAWNVAANARAEAFHRRRAPTGAEALEAPGEAARNPVEEDDARRWLHRVIEGLPPAARTVVKLRIEDELSWRGIARALAPGEDATRRATSLRKSFERTKHHLAQLAREVTPGPIPGPIPCAASWRGWGTSMIETELRGNGSKMARQRPLIPDTTGDFQESIHRIQNRVETPRAVPIPVPFPIQPGSRVRIWKQDPSVGEPGLRLAYLPGLVQNGPADVRIQTDLAGTTPVIRNAAGDFIFTAETPEADCVNAFAVARMAMTLCQQAVEGHPIPWAWNTGGNTLQLTVRPRGFSGANAYYSRTGKTLSFGYFTPASGTPVYTCRSLDIVAHECGHAILDGLKPAWLAAGNPPQTGALHESFGDLVAVFLSLSHLDQAEALVALTGADLHEKNFLAALAEQFGDALGMPFGLRNADNDLKLSQVSNQVHALSQVFTGAIYDVLADIFAYELRRQGTVKGPALILVEVARALLNVLVRAIREAPAQNVTFVDVGNQLLKVSRARNEPEVYRRYIRNRFQLREMALPVGPIPFLATGDIAVEEPGLAAAAGDVDLQLAPHVSADRKMRQDRTGCCGTMTQPEFLYGKSEILARGLAITDEVLFEEERAALKTSFR